MVFRLNNTFADPDTGAGVQRGFPAPGAGAQTTGPATPLPGRTATQRSPVYPTKGRRTWFRPSSPDGGQRGFPDPLGPAQARPAGSMDNRDYVQSGLPVEVWTPYYSRGTAAWVPNYGKVLTNPIGAGIEAKYRPQASYGGAAQYENGALWWTSQSIPTSVNLQGLTDPQELADILGMVYVQGVVRTTG